MRAPLSVRALRTGMLSVGMLSVGMLSFVGTLLLSGCGKDAPQALGTLEFDRVAVPAPVAERIVAIDVRALGLAIVTLGGGRTRTEDPIDCAVGLTDVAAIGEAVEPDGRPLAIVRARNAESAERARDTIRAAVTLARPEAAIPAPPPLVAARIVS